ncbi:hypothetical protein SM124_13485 [Bacillus sp. 31A1R]|uniref:Uncharacterized protein n=1 Tax=Robertmurraya mangrovi TaxID=3098077 RepID=A0ABU5J005_9BACI|nr:hypothetical protein [Bacillus sp. 31A1R]MDZ5472740.1 hypothetical protein [Bacillus sp. 31A1R]
MSNLKLFTIIGLFLFSGMALQILIQLDQMYKIVEASIFVGVSAIIYFISVLIYHKNKSILIPFIAVLAFIAIGMIFLQGFIFGTHH